MASSADGTRIAWYRYGAGERAILFVPTWNLVDARVWATRSPHSNRTRPVPVALAESIVAVLPNARLVLIPGGGHRPDIRTPELVNPVLLEFLLNP